MAIESALIPVCLPLIQFSLKQPERFVQRNRTKIIKNVSALRLGLQHTRFRSAFDDPPIIEQMRAAYLELAMRRHVALATTDEALRRAAAKAGVPLIKTI